MRFYRHNYQRGPIVRERLPASLSRTPATHRGANKIRLLIAFGIALFSIVSFLGSKEYNPYTKEHQYIAIAPHQEIALGLQATPEMIEQYGGLDPDQEAQERVDRIGNAIYKNSKAANSEWKFNFHLLNDPKTVNAFALPGGPIFITKALYDKLQTDGQLAAVLGHEIGHVVGRHAAQRIAKSKLTQGRTGAVITASGRQDVAVAAMMIGQMVNMKYGRDDELESDILGVLFMSEAGYDPRAMIIVMKILDEASSGSRQLEFFSTHPNPDNRIERIKMAIRKVFPQGVPEGLQP